MKISWTSITQPDPERNYLALICFNERKSVWEFFKFLMSARGIQTQIKNAKGAIGYMAQLNFMDKKGYKLPVWDDEKALMSFAHSGQPLKVMKKLKPSLTARAFVRSVLIVRTFRRNGGGFHQTAKRANNQTCIAVKNKNHKTCRQQR